MRGGGEAGRSWDTGHAKCQTRRTTAKMATRRKEERNRGEGPRRAGWCAGTDYLRLRRRAGIGCPRMSAPVARQCRDRKRKGGPEATPASLLRGQPCAN